MKVSRRGLRVALAGATGALAGEVLALLAERSFPVRELLPFATERSVGRTAELGDEVVAVGSEMPSLAGVDLLIVCTPREPALEMVRQALRASVYCIDCSGALAESPDVPLLVSDLCLPSEVRAPVIMCPSGPALGWSPVLSALQEAAGLRRVVGTLLQSASCAGRGGIEALSAETIALLRQKELPSSAAFPGPVAFDCAPNAGGLQVPTEAEGEGEGEGKGEAEAEISSRSESRLTRELERLFPGLEVAVTGVQVPTFVGEGSALAVETERPLSPHAAGEAIAKMPGVDLWSASDSPPSMRDAAGRDAVLVGRLRRDRTHDCGLLLWIAADGLRLAAANVVKLAEARLRLN
jgi:aspartate-semialdehyde dehydrogenase